MERPKALEGRATLTPEEVARLKGNATCLFEGDGDAAFGDSIFVSAQTGVEAFKSNDGGTGNDNQFWLVDREFDNRTSLVIDPPDGRLPALTAQAQQRQAARAAARRGRPADGPEDRSLGERCITFGVPMAGAGYNSNAQYEFTRRRGGNVQPGLDGDDSAHADGREDLRVCLSRG